MIVELKCLLKNYQQTYKLGAAAYYGHMRYYANLLCKFKNDKLKITLARVLWW